jgi:hypothetical protein
MNKDYMNKLISDIQEYLREEDMKAKRERYLTSEPEPAPAGRLRLRRPVYSVLITLFSACALGSITVAILLMGLVGGPRIDSVGTIWLLAAGGCGIFFSAMLISVWKRLVVLVQIERNTRQILDSRHRTNELLERLVRNMN